MVKTFKEEKVGCYLLESGSAQPFTPGTKPAMQPVWNENLCVRCALCSLYCPTGAISRQDNGFYNVDSKRCTGCGICHRECWFGAVSMQEVD